MWKLNEMLVRVLGIVCLWGRVEGLSPAKAGASGGVHRGEKDSI